MKPISAGMIQAHAWSKGPSAAGNHSVLEGALDIGYKLNSYSSRAAR